MKRSLIWLALPILLGLSIAVFALVVPAQASRPAPALDDPEHDPDPKAETKGVIDSFPGGLVGTWTISGIVYTATDKTHFSMEEGPFETGACVEVKFNPLTNISYSIETTEPEDCGEDSELYFIGLIEQVPVSSPDMLDHDHDPIGISGTWTISGTEFVSTLDTRLSTRNGPLEVGACASVKYRVVNGINMAEKIRSEKLYRCLGPVAFNQAYGYVATFPPDLHGAWVITDTAGMSLSFMSTPSTYFNFHRYPIDTGACVWVKYFNNQSVNYAAHVKTTDPSHCEGQFIDYQPLSKLYATVEALPPGGIYTGTWMLAGVNFTATEFTRFEEEEGPLAVGSCAEAKYDPSNGAMLIRKLESEETEDCQAGDGSPRFKLFGVVEIMPSGGFSGTWQVSGVTFSVTPTTTMEARHGDFALGAYVKVYFTYDATTGERTALVLKTHVAPGYGWKHHHGRFDGWNFSSLGDQIILDGNYLTADPDIDVPADLKAGDMVWVNVYQDLDGQFVTQVLLDQTIHLPLIQH